jgi:hypothetical protein
VSTSQAAPQPIEVVKLPADSMNMEQQHQQTNNGPATPTTVLQPNNMFHPVIVEPTQLVPVLPLAQKRPDTREKNGVLGKKENLHMYQ